MNKRYMPAIAALLIAITCTTFVPVFAQLPTFIYAAPTLTVVTIAQDDQLRNTGIILLASAADEWGVTPPTPLTSPATASSNTATVQDWMAQFKLIVSYNGVPVVPTAVYCQVIEKDKYNPLKDKQFTAENLKTVPKDMSLDFYCKERWGKPGVGVLDVYYMGPGEPVNIADYILFITVSYVVGRNTVWGADMQDICLLGWPADDTPNPLYSDGTTAHTVLTNIFADPLTGWKSCEDFALYQKYLLGVPTPWS